MMYSISLKNISRKDVKTAGGKGASLGELMLAKIPVPPGFVITSQTFDQLLSSSGLQVKANHILKSVRPNKSGSAEQASKKIRALINGLQVPSDIKREIGKEFKKLKAKFVAVRSSATAEDSKSASWAGELDTYLNVIEPNLVKAVKNCWSSLFSPRAIVYRFEHGLAKKPISVAVVVQKMIEAEVAGVCFTVHPVTKNKNQMVIEAAFGLGEALVSGQITPDTYIVDKGKFSLIQTNISYQNMKIVRTDSNNTEKKLNKSEGSKQKLTSGQISKLAKLAKHIEAHYRYPQDIEWALSKGKFYVTQSRPITTLS